MLINLRNALMAGKWLLYDAEVEYLESTGMQYIDTGVECTSDLDVDFVISTATAPNIATLGIIQHAPAGYSGYFRYHYSPSTNAAFWVQIDALNTASISSIDFTPNEIYHWTANPTLGIAKCNGKSVSFAALPQGVRSGLNFYIFARNGFNGVQSMPSKIYSFKIWQNGVLIRDYIPVRNGTVGYLYDRVSGKLFGNAGTGDFVLGPDVVPVEYIESHGTEWIDTGVYGSDAVKATLDLQLISLGRSRGVFGAYSSTSSSLYLYQSGSGGGVWQVGFGHYGNTTKKTDTERHDVELYDFHVDIDGETIATFSQSQFTTSHTMTIFTARNETGGVYISSRSRCYRCGIWQSNIPVRSFYPVRVGTDATSWEGAMMDTLTRRIYRNAGTGAFTYGNGLKYPIPA